MTEQQTYGVAWCDGRDPEDGGWHFDSGGTVSGYDMAYKTTSRQAALDLGVPAAVLDLFEADQTEPGQDTATYPYEQPGYGLFGWLQDNAGLFRS